MKKKYLNIALFVLLIIIWGATFYKYFGRSSEKIPAITNDNVFSKLQPELQEVKETYQLNIVNEDPFKTSKPFYSTSIVKPTKGNKKKVVSKSKANTSIKWPTITYYGFVKGDRQNTRLVLLKIDNRIYRKRELETVKELKILKAYNDSLVISLNNNKKTIKRQ